MQAIKFKKNAVGLLRAFSVFFFVVFFVLIIFVFTQERKMALTFLPFFIVIESLPTYIFVSSFTKCWFYDSEKFVKRKFIFKKTVFYKEILYFKNETCFSPGFRDLKPSFYKSGFFTLANGKKVEFDIVCEASEFLKMWRLVKKANPKVQLIELPK